MTIKLPYKYTPRDYQIPIFKALDNGKKRLVQVMHRRGGKDKTFINLIANQIPQRLGAYHYYFPTASLGREVIWDGMDKDGMKFLDHFPQDMIAKKNEHEMKLTFHTGSTFRILGTDKLNVVGPNPVGCCFSEFGKQNPRVWDFVRPILTENDGWAAFNGTPRGKNHFYRMLQKAKLSDRWFSEVLTVDDTHAIPLSKIQEEREDGMSEEMIQQEFYCSFEFGLEGAYYAKLMAKAFSEGRIGDVPHQSDYGVFTSWDIGVGDTNAIWFLQQINNWLHAIDYYEMNNMAVDHYASICRKKEIEEGYNYIAHYAPHDIDVREWGAEQAAKRIETARKLGINFTKIPKVKNKQDEIDVVRAVLPLTRFDRKKCRAGIEALQDFQKEFNETYQIFANKPLDNWAKHGADAFGCGAVALKIHGDISGGGMSEQDARELESQYASQGAM